MTTICPQCGSDRVSERNIGRKAGGIAGGVAGALSGAGTGAAIGSVVPVVEQLRELSLAQYWEDLSPVRRLER